MKNIQEKLKKYKAKSDGTSIYQHNMDLLNTLKQLKTIHDITEEQYASLKKSIVYHDVGKTTDEFQNNIKSTHRKMRHEVLSASVKKLTEIERLSILLHHKTIDKLLQYIDNVYYDEQLKEVVDKLSIETENIMSYLKKIGRPSRKNHKLLNSKELILQLGYLKLCDHIASAGIEKIDGGFHAKTVYNFEKYKSIQKKVLDLDDKKDIIVQAPTGIGKTETSLLWSDLVQNEYKNKRVFYILPYTASINALYKRLKKDGVSVGVLHGKVHSLLNKEDDIKDKREELQLFRKNIKQITICTIFQLIKAIFSCKNFEMILAQLKNSVVIIDEIHCFDIRQFTLLIEILKFLKKEYDVSICIMSASIPECMLNRIKDELNIHTVINANKEDFLIRHHIDRVNKTIFNDLENIESQINKNKQTLICVNNVNTSQEVYTYLKNKYPKKKIRLIHGRFNAKDRSNIEKDLKICDILIGTQAIEVSLDIDYDIMFTEIAPLDSLLQRFGRVNRKGKKDIAEIYIYNQYNKFSIYDKTLIDLTDKSIYEIITKDNGIIYEDKINTYLNKVYIEFPDEEYDTYKNQFNDLKGNMRVGYYNKNATETMIGDSNSVQILPINLFGRYVKLIKNHKYIEANELFVNTYINGYKEGQEWYYDKDFDIYISNYIYDDRGLTKEIDYENSII